MSIYEGLTEDELKAQFPKYITPKGRPSKNAPQQFKDALYSAYLAQFDAIPLELFGGMNNKMKHKHVPSGNEWSITPESLYRFPVIPVNPAPVLNDSGVPISAWCVACNSMTNRYAPRASKHSKTGSCQKCAIKNATKQYEKPEVLAQRAEQARIDALRIYDASGDITHAYCPKCEEVTPRQKQKENGANGMCQPCKAAYDSGEFNKANKRKPEYRARFNAWQRKPENRAKARVYEALPENREKTRIYNASLTAKMARFKYEKTDKCKTYRFEFDTERRIEERADVVDTLNVLAIEHGLDSFIDEINSDRVLIDKDELQNEHLYQYLVFHALVNKGLYCVKEHKANETDRYDIYIPDHNLIIELKVNAGRNWNYLGIKAQMDRYNVNAPECTVLGSAPNGEYGLLNFVELMGEVDRLTETI